MKKINRFWRLAAVLVGLILLLLGAVGVYQASGRRGELRFSTLEQAGSLGRSEEYWQQRQPGLLIVANRDDVTKASRFVSDQATQALSRLYFRNCFAILAFRGWHSTILEGFQIERLIDQGDVIAIYAEPGKRTGQDAISSPYHLINVCGAGKRGQTITFSLYFGEDQAAVVSVSRTLP